jgi:S-adenosylmethionine/arginine decarboxylase-like enzyme
MAQERSELKRAVHTMLNDVVEQCFRHLIHYPQHSDELNKIIKDTSDEINYQVLKIDAHSHAEGSDQLNHYYRDINYS